MTDLHCHLLPGVDDGAKDTDMSLELLRQERNQGVTYFSPVLAELDVSLLCYTRTPYLLLEFPTTREPAFLERVLFDLQTRGIRPIIAHVERYQWLQDRPDILFDWVDRGLILQSNAGALLREGESEKIIRRLIDYNMVKVLSSDAHHPDRRPADLGSGLMYVSERVGEEKARELLQNGNRIFRGEEIIENPPIPPRRRFGKWV